MGVRGQRHSPTVLPSGKRPAIHFIRGWLGSEPVWSGAKNLPRNVQLVANRFTYCAIASQFNISRLNAIPFFPYKLSYTLALDRSKWLVSRCSRFSFKTISPGTHRIRVYVGHRNGLHSCDYRSFPTLQPSQDTG